MADVPHLHGAAVINRIDLSFTIRFESQEIDGKHYINEHVSTQRGFTQYGPMPEDKLQPFVDERKAYWHEMSARYGALVNALK